jgi:hypothetical protein
MKPILCCLLLALASFLHADPWKVERDNPLETPGGSAQDIRWNSDSEVLVAEGRGGVSVRNVSKPNAVLRYAIPKGTQGFFFASRLASSSAYVVTAAPFGSFGWRDVRTPNMPTESAAMGMLIDVDVRGDRLAILGGNTNEKGGTPDGILTVTSLSRKATDRQIVMQGPTGPKGKELARCYLFEPGAVRYLPDGSLIVVPGLMPGAYQYDDAGKLLRTWQTDDLLILDECRITDEQMMAMAADFSARTDWMSQYTIVDDILPFGDGPGLLLRTVRDGGTRWEIAYLLSSGKVRRERLPFHSPSPRAHLRGDVRGNRVALLLFDYELPNKAPLPARLIIATRK